MKELIQRMLESIRNNDVDSVKDIIEGNKEERKEPIRHIAVLYSAIKNKTDVLEYLLNNLDEISKDTINDTLVQASIANAEDSVRLIIKKGKHINLSNIISECMAFGGSEQEGYYASVIYKRFETMIFVPVDKIVNDSAKIVKVLLRNGISVSVKNTKGETPLQCAISTGNDDLIKSILEYHARPRYTKKSLIGYTLRDLHIAEEDLMFLLNSSWFREKKGKRESIKEDIKSIINNDSDNELKNKLQKIAEKREMYDIKVRIEQNQDIKDIAHDVKNDLKGRLKEYNELFDIVNKLKTRIELNTKDNVFYVIDLCKQNNINSFNI